MSPGTIKSTRLPLLHQVLRLRLLQHQDLLRHRGLAQIDRLAQRRDSSAFDRKQRVLRIRACASG
jgi:hypothetical protein